MELAKLLDEFKSFFRGAGLTGDALDMVDSIEEDEFDMVLGTMLESEQAWFGYEPPSDYDTLVKYYVYTKFLHRFWDAKYERTGFDNEKMQLVFTGDASMVESGIELNTYLALKAKGLYSIKDAAEYLASDDIDLEQDIYEDAQNHVLWFLNEVISKQEVADEV